MSIYYASVVYTSTPETRQPIPVGGNHALKFPYNEQNDPWGMHPKRRPDGYVVRDFLTDPESAIIIPAVTGLATIQLDIAWTGQANAYRSAVVGENLPFENTHTDIRPDLLWTSLTPVRAGEPIAVLVGHTAATPLQIASARITVTIQDDIAVPPERPVRVRGGDDPYPETQPEAPANPGGSTPPVNDDDTIPR